MTPWLLWPSCSRAASISGRTVGVLRAGGSEANPILPQRPALNLTVGTAITVGEIAAVTHLAHTHPTAAKWVLVVGIVVEGIVVAHNWRELTVEGR